MISVYRAAGRVVFCTSGDTLPEIDAVDRDTERRVERRQQALAKVVRQRQQPPLVPPGGA